MSAAVIPGQIFWGVTRDSEGHRDYTIKHKVKTTTREDGPNTVLNASGLPTIGSFWSFDNDVDTWAFCYPDAKVNYLGGGDAGSKFWSVEQKFSTRPLKRCQDVQIEDPLLEPQKVSGTFVKYTKEAKTDRYGTMIKTSSHEIVRGAQVEFDANRPAVHIEQNVADLELSTVADMVDTLNDATLWGLPARKIKLSNFSWERKHYAGCSVYYTRIFDFDIKRRDDDSFDRVILDEGTMVLKGHHATAAEIAGTGDPDGNQWVLDYINGAAPDPDNPLHFTRYKDRSGEYARVILDGAGQPWSGSGTADITITIEYYPESNFLLLGIPTTF